MEESQSAGSYLSKLEESNRTLDTILNNLEEHGPSSVSGGALYVVNVQIVCHRLLRVEFESKLLLQRFSERLPPRI